MMVRVRSVAVLTAVCFALFFRGLDRTDLWSAHEARAAQNAQRMLDDRSWCMPRLYDGQFDLQKPPGYYWLVAVIASLGDGVVDRWAVRLPAAIGGLLTVLMIYLFLARNGRPTAGLTAGIILASSIHFTSSARTGRIDMPMTCAVTAAILLLSSPRKRVVCCGLGGIALASAILLKGPVGAVLPMTVLSAWICWQRGQPQWIFARCSLKKLPHSALAPQSRAESKSIAVAAASQVTEDCFALSNAPPHPPPGAAGGGRGGGILENPTCQNPLSPQEPVRGGAPLPWQWLSVGLALLIGTVLAMPWFLWANEQTNGEFFRVFFWHHNVERAMGESPTLAVHPWWYYVPRFAVDFLPWTPLLVMAVCWFLRVRPTMEPDGALGLFWFVTVVLVLSLSQFKRADYLLPAYPGAAVFAGCTIEQWTQRLAVRWRKSLAAGFVVTFAAVLAGWWWFHHRIEPRQEAVREQQAFAAHIRELAPRPETVLLFRVESHLLAYHLRRPIHTLVEWGEINERMAQPGSHWFVTRAEFAEQCRQNIKARQIDVIARSEDFSRAPPLRPLVLMRTID